MEKIHIREERTNMSKKNDTDNTNLLKPVPPQNSDITLCPDGVYRWVYELNLYKNPTVLFTLYKIFGAILLAIVVLVLVSDLGQPWFVNHPQEQIIANLSWIVIFALFFFVLITASYYIYALMQGGKYCVMFEMDDDKIIHRQYAEQVEKAQIVSLITALAGGITGNVTATGIGINSAVNTETISHFDAVCSIKPYRKRNVIKVNEPLMKNQIYADGTDFDFVLKYISSRCTKM